MDKLPPIEKVHEAWSAIADGRVHMDPEGHRAEVMSSDGSKTYTVTWDETGEKPKYTSNDNATYWKLYPGYPILAVMMLRGQLPLDREEMQRWGGVNWKVLNDAHRRDYAAAVSQVMAGRGMDAAATEKAAQRVHGLLGDMDVKIGRGSVRPPK